jgi:hypothetical protein
MEKAHGQKITHRGQPLRPISNGPLDDGPWVTYRNRARKNNMYPGRTDLVVLLLRFVVGLLLGGILFLCMSLWWGLPLNITVPVPFLVALCATIWGDRFIIAFMKLLGHLA